MSAEKFKFVSPGVFVKEIDRSEIGGGAVPPGPVVIGRTEKGPAFRPTMVNSWDEYVQVFGYPIPGGAGGDVWRDGNNTSPTYASYAAQAYLRNNGPITVVRLLGVQDDDAEATTAANGAAGWSTTNIGTNVSDGGAYGLFMFDSGSTTDNAKPTINATLAAIWYLNGARITLSGVIRQSVSATASNGAMLKSTANREFKAIIDDGESKTYAFNFDVNSDRYIRRVFNTNPVKTNSSLNDAGTLTKYWLGESFDRSVNDFCSGSTQFGVIMGLKNGSNQGHDFLGIEARPGETGYFISQDLVHPSGSGFSADAQDELFKVVALDTNGEHAQNKIKISINDLKAPVDKDVDPYGSFSIEVRKIEDTDSRPEILETFTGLNLNPTSPNYAAARVGDRYISWNSSERRYREYNDYGNRSKYIRLEMHANIKNGLVDKESIPFGVKGPLKFGNFRVSGSTSNNNLSGLSGSFASIDGICSPHVNISPDGMHIGGKDPTDVLFKFPSIPLRSGSNEPESYTDPKKAYFGVELLRSGSTTRFDHSVRDLLRPKPGAINSFTPSTTTEHMWVFTMDDIRDAHLDGGHRLYESGSRLNGTSVSAVSGGYQNVLDQGFKKFTTVLHGGFDGLDITESDPFRNTLLSGKTSKTNYAYASIKRALEVIEEPDEMEFNLAVMPGITNEALTQNLTDVCEDRGDALAIVDVKGGYEPLHEGVPSTYPKVGSVSDTVSNMKARDLNSSYACCYYPWVQIKDPASGQLLWTPPSVVALGTMASTEANAELWFAPAGFNRGGLSEGSAGIKVLSAREKLTSTQRDDLYENRINPIASFPSEGIVVFGQKTTQIKRTALDRINVRRLMIFLKKEISRISNRILFDQNVQTTWNRFLGQVNPLLNSVKARYGLSDYRVVLDDTTTTPDMIDRNILYAKIMLKPARAIEFIALDFSIMRSGAAFDD